MEAASNRIKDAIIFLKDGLPFRIGDLYLRLYDRKALNVTGISRSTVIGNITEESALAELNDIKRIFNTLISDSPEFRAFVKNMVVQYSLDLDYGMGDIRICSEINGLLEWKVNLNKKHP